MVKSAASRGCGGDAEAGFAAVDALVALTILAMTIALALQAMQTARRMAGAALEARSATAVLQWLLQSDPDEIGARSGSANGFAWRAELALNPSDPQAPAVRTCTRSASVARVGGRRSYAARALVFCRPPAQS